MSGGKIRCEACPVMCYVAEGQTGACDRYANEGGRSHSLGIADAVTVIARCAAGADAAATMIANAVGLPGHPTVERRPARDLAPDSDLGARPVTVGLGPLNRAEVARALASGADRAARLRTNGLIGGAHLTLRGQSLSLGAAEANSHRQEPENA